jgi:Zinc finger, C2H2 type/Zinc-finger of C2H2 type
VTRISAVRNNFIHQQKFLINLLGQVTIKLEETEQQLEPVKILESFIFDEYQNENDDRELMKEKHLEETSDLDCKDDNDEDSKDEDFEVKTSSSRKRTNSVKCIEEDDSGSSKPKKKKKKYSYYVRKTPRPDIAKRYCDICNRYCRSEKRVKEHKERAHEGKKNFSCDENECDYMSYSQAEMTLHKFRKHGIGEGPSIKKDGYFCDTCGMRFKMPDKLKHHIGKKHLNIRNFICDYCPMRFYLKQDLKKHIIRHIPREHRTFSATCDICGNVYFNRHTLKSHKELVHERLKRFSCELCGKLYDTKSRLKIHIDSFHKGLREIECTICNGKYTTKLALKGHIKRQHPETLGLEKKTFTCEICQTIIPSKAYLHQHMKTHGEPQFPCNQCDKKYFVNYKLMDHMAVHTPLQFRCEYCPRSFRTEARLKGHYRVVHFKEKKTYRCEICNGTYTRRTTLRDHVVRQHPSIDESYKQEYIARVLQMQPEEYDGGK